jgi:iron complex transport system substrate-binding protein
MFHGIARYLLLALLGLALATGVAAAQTRSFVDSAGRQVQIPARVSRVFAAGPPASVLVYTLAPDKLAGWIRAPTAEERPFLLPQSAALPVHGRLTGRGDSANVEAVLAMRPDLIVDVGTIDATYASLADRVQQQTGIPYVLIDGAFANTAQTYRTLGALIGETARAEELAAYAERTMGELRTRLAAIPASQRPRVYYGRGPRGLETGLSGSINLEVLEQVGAVNVAAELGRGGLANVSLEQVLGWNPDVILTLDGAFYRAVGGDPLWQPIKAVRERRVTWRRRCRGAGSMRRPGSTG